MAEEFKPKLTGEEFVVKLKEAGFTEKTIDALQEEDINSDTALKILSERDIETIADEKKLTIGQKRLLVEFSATLKPKRDSDRSERSESSHRSTARAPPRGARYQRTKSRSPLSDRRRHDGDRENPEQSTCIGVFNLPYSTKSDALYDIFSRFGYVKDVNLVMDKITGASRGFAFIYFADMETAVYAKESCAGMTVEGNTIRTEFSITKRAHSPTPGAYLGSKRTEKSERGGRPERGRSSRPYDDRGEDGFRGDMFRGAYAHPRPYY